MASSKPNKCHGEDVPWGSHQDGTAVVVWLQSIGQINRANEWGLILFGHSRMGWGLIQAGINLRGNCMTDF